MVAVIRRFIELLKRFFLGFGFLILQIVFSLAMFFSTIIIHLIEDEDEKDG